MWKVVEIMIKQFVWIAKADSTTISEPRVENVLGQVSLNFAEIEQTDQFCWKVTSNEIFELLEKINFRQKLIRLTRMTFVKTKSEVKVDGDLTDRFVIQVQERWFVKILFNLSCGNLLDNWGGIYFARNGNSKVRCKREYG